MSAAVPFLPMSPALEGIPGPAFGRVLDVQLHVAWISEGSLNKISIFFGDQTMPMSHVIWILLSLGAQEATKPY